MAHTPHTIEMKVIVDVDYRGKVRARDPETSWDAAGRQTRRKSEQLRIDILMILKEHGALNDSEIGAKYAALRADTPDMFRPATEQSIRSRRKELQLESLVRDTGRKRPSANDHPSIVWEATL